MNPGAAAGGVVVTYHPDAEFPRRLAAIAREAAPLIVVDNTAHADVQQRLRSSCDAFSARLMANSANLGLGAALNAGFAALAQQGCRFAFAFDQDSAPEPGFARASLALATAGSRYAAVGANWFDAARPDTAARHPMPKRGFPLLFTRRPATTNLPEVTCVIASGSLFNLQAWRELGGFHEGLFLDLVDTEFCLRARAGGWKIGVAAEARLSHRRGSKRPVRRLGRTWWPAFIPPCRLHCMFRNRMHLLRRHGRRNPHWALYECIYAAKNIADVVLLEDAKAAKLGACVRGLRDGLLGRLGPIEPPHAMGKSLP